MAKIQASLDEPGLVVPARMGYKFSFGSNWLDYLISPMGGGVRKRPIYLAIDWK